jgi:hypothetical protein
MKPHKPRSETDLEIFDDRGLNLAPVTRRDIYLAFSKRSTIWAEANIDMNAHIIKHLKANGGTKSAEAYDQDSPNSDESISTGVLVVSTLSDIWTSFDICFIGLDPVL